MKEALAICIPVINTGRILSEINGNASNGGEYISFVMPLKESLCQYPTNQH